MIYIAGKITGLPASQVDAKFQEAENKLHALGLKVINPRKLGISDNWPWNDQMAVCYKVIEERATAIFLLEDWTESKDAKLEFKRVCDINRRRKANPMQIYFEDFHGYTEIEMDVRENILTCLIPTEHDN